MIKIKDYLNINYPLGAKIAYKYVKNRIITNKNKDKNIILVK